MELYGYKSFSILKEEYMTLKEAKLKLKQVNKRIATCLKRQQFEYRNNTMEDYMTIYRVKEKPCIPNSFKGSININYKKKYYTTGELKKMSSNLDQWLVHLINMDIVITDSPRYWNTAVKPIWKFKPVKFKEFVYAV